jgi:hypothetical protein
MNTELQSRSGDLIEDEREVATLPTDMALMSAISRAELDSRITTARAFPRSIKRFINETRDMACLSEEIAAECFYVIPRGGKKIEGPSVRMAEIVQCAWGNCESGARVVDEGEKFITAQGIFYDLERNVKIAWEVRRRITDKDGKRFNEDMIGVTGAAASSIALRNAIFRGVPKVFWNSVYEETRKVARGTLKSLVTNRSDALDWLARRGVPNATVIAALGVGGLEDIGLDELETLRGMVGAIKDGEQIETVFAPKEVKAPQSKQKPATAEPKKRGRPPKSDTPLPPTAGAGPGTPAEASVAGAPQTDSSSAIPGASQPPGEVTITLDQATFLADSMKEEGVQLTRFLAEFELGNCEDLPASKYAQATAWILAQ